MDGISPLAAGLLGSLAAGLMTAVGALPVFAKRSWSNLDQVLLLGLAAGIMLGATSFSLLVPALEVLENRGAAAATAALTVAGGTLLGAVAVWLLNRSVPHEHFVKGREGVIGGLGRYWLFILAITLHNFPEGMSVGVAFGGPDTRDGLPLAIGIGLQNMPEGLAVAAALIDQGYGRGRAFLFALLTGLVEPLGGLVGAGVVSLSQALLPWALAFSGGAMLYVISGEVIPETHRSGREDRATLAVVVGFVLMMMLDVALG